MTNIVHIRSKHPIHLEQPLVLALRACRRVIGVGEGGGGGGWVFNGMRISIISSPNSKEEFLLSSIMFEIFIFFAFVFPKEPRVMRSWWGSILQVQEYN